MAGQQPVLNVAGTRVAVRVVSGPVSDSRCATIRRPTSPTLASSSCAQERAVARANTVNTLILLSHPS